VPVADWPDEFLLLDFDKVGGAKVGRGVCIDVERFSPGTAQSSKGSAPGGEEVAVGHGAVVGFLQRSVGQSGVLSLSTTSGGTDLNAKGNTKAIKTFALTGQKL